MVKECLVFDLDGTLFTDFLERDKEYINKVFVNNKVVLWIDKVARFVNSFDIIKNSMFFLKIRLAVYSIFSFKSYKKIMSEYEKWYVEEATLAIVKNIFALRRLKKYETLILSNNLFSKKVKFLKNVKCNCKLITTKNKYRTLKEISENKDIKFMIGNNLMDDILTAKKLGIDTIYLGESNIVKFFATKTFSNILNIISYIEYQDVKME